MTYEERINLAALLMKLSDEEINPLMGIKRNDQDFDGLRKANDARENVLAILEFIDSLNGD